ncbi:hypothetical protein H4R33_004426 [Dimargaris cristalligena]|uniref:Extracellular membrane protein CFEM domain-containing protein n=1 Tax=Dimargaris cristalligena TaxID=215637 RepID=A0A4P9ZXX1_9FUNG|nr:hypothetical protein H4R33_004426 [Dimargaris cristalligena]RKP37891.1 hypothetical protein BJ085DRAFT_34036 [Dimargaris cristalligena]|eukprot:RKP37891.1 hypothetical protein BJ085DRAFT_34036 [Dimargaris cristalligena]
MVNFLANLSFCGLIAAHFLLQASEASAADGCRMLSQTCLDDKATCMQDCPGIDSDDFNRCAKTCYPDNRFNVPMLEKDQRYNCFFLCTKASINHQAFDLSNYSFKHYDEDYVDSAAPTTTAKATVTAAGIVSAGGSVQAPQAITYNGSSKTQSATARVSASAGADDGGQATETNEDSSSSASHLTPMYLAPLALALAVLI